MKLGGLAESYKEQSMNKDFQKMISTIVFHYWLTLNIQDGKITNFIDWSTQPPASIEEIEYYENWKSDKKPIIKLSSGNYI